ncbi:MAG: hypothetical protein PHF73_12665, partial [Massilibacteroides sp.]|nr:hypothetical protein [Massilibacteroides sp.]
MKREMYIFIMCCLFLFCSKGYTQTLPSDSLKMDIFLNESMLKEALINIKFVNSMDYSPTGFILLASSNQFYMLGIGGIHFTFKKTKMKIDDYTVTQDNALLVVSGNKLCNIDTLGSLSTIYDLPISNAGIISGNNNDVIYIYDRNFQKGKKEYALYKISDIEQHTRLLSVPTPVTSVYEYKADLLLATNNKIICVDNNTKTFFDFFSLPQKQDIISIAGDTINHALYFSTQDTIYRIQNGVLEYVCTEFGGTLMHDGDGLLVFNPEKKLIVRLRNNLLYPQKIKENNIPKINKDNYLSDEKLRDVSIQDIRNLVIQKRIGEAVKGYSHLVAKDSLNTNLLAEYSYALALSGAYDCALMNLDRVR